jgi:hypothetical protein
MEGAGREGRQHRRDGVRGDNATTISTATGGMMALWDVPFELVGEVAGAGAVAEAGDVERGAASARHVGGAGIRAECGCSDTDAVVETGVRGSGWR